MRGLLTGLMLAILCVLNSCGYRGEDFCILERYNAISVPFIEGDQDGLLTAAIVKELSSSSPLPYSQNYGDLILRAKILGIDEDNIGYRYERKKSGDLRKRLAPCETRVTARLEVYVEDLSGQIVIPKVIISASQDFDHDYYSSRNGVNIFSLGQLTEVDAARDAVISPLNENISKKIVDYLSDSW